MITHLVKIFKDQKLVDKIKKRLPYLFQIAEIESSRAGKIGMEVGSLFTFENMKNQKNYNIKHCHFCNEKLDKIWFTASMTEEWSWNGANWECSSRHSLITDSEQNVICPNCERVIGKGVDFGF